MVEIKDRISFDEFDAVVKKVVKDCFIEGTYSPSYYELSFRTALFTVFAPDFEIDKTDNNTAYECVESKEAWEVMTEIKRRKQYYDLEMAIRNGINFKKDMLISQNTSLTDVVLSKILGVLNDKLKTVQDIDTETVNKFMDKVNGMDNISEDAIIKALTDLKVIDKE